MAGQCDASRTAMRIGVFVIHSIVGIGYVSTKKDCHGCVRVPSD